MTIAGMSWPPPEASKTLAHRMRPPQLRDLHEEITPGGEDEQHLPGGVVHGEAGCDETPQIARPGGDRTRQLVDRGASGVVVRKPGDGDRAHPARVREAPGGEVGELGERAVEGSREAAVGGQGPQGIGAEPAAQRFRRQAGLPDVGDERGRDGERRSAGVENDVDAGEVDTPEKRPELVGGRQGDPACSHQSSGAVVIGVHSRRAAPSKRIQR